MSEGYCDVSLGDYDGDTAQFYTEREVTARKDHQCYECCEPIRKGEKHQLVTGRWEGEFTTYRFCAPCWEITGEFSDGARTFGIAYDTFTDEWRNGATLQGCLNRVS